MGRRAYDKVRDMYNWLKTFEKLVRESENIRNPEKIAEYRKKYLLEIREELKRVSKYMVDPLERPLYNGWRGQIDEDGDGGKDYRILKVENPEDWTDEEIDEYIMCEVGYPPINSPYDCTGKRFTRWTSWSRQPVGIVMIHAWGLDV